MPNETVTSPEYDLRQKLDARFKVSDPELYEAVLRQIEESKATAKHYYQEANEAIKARDRWKKIAMEALERAQIEIDKNQQPA